MHFLDFFTPSNLLTIFFGVTSLVLAIWVIPRRRLTYSIDSRPLVTANMTDIPDISVLFAGKPVASIISSKIEFRNYGNRPLLPKDFAPTAPLKIVVSGRIYTTESSLIVTSSYQSSNIRTKLNGKDISFQFDYIKKKQRFSLTLLHSGSISVSGELIDGKLRDPASVNRLYSIIQGVLGALFIVCAISYAILDNIYHFDFTMRLIISCAITVQSAAIFFLSLRRNTKNT